jgi:hypothetical protein
MVAAKGWGLGGSGELVFSGYRVSVWEDERFSSWRENDSTAL